MVRTRVAGLLTLVDTNNKWIGILLRLHNDLLHVASVDLAESNLAKMGHPISDDA